ncbi:MAG: flagellar hook protein FlgE [Deltaproteobacteria bacterium]|nr:flagellar hook protein FlgE [Deltaproteobacteria bacterium]
MSLSSALFSGISGLSTLGNSMTVIGDNIANVNTVGFKASRVTFQDVLSQTVATTAGTAQVGRGTNLADISSSFAQGSFESTDSTTDLAIGGEGFFMVRDPNNENNEFYTRAGEFQFDKDGNFTNPAGYIVRGWSLDSTGNNTGSIGDITLSSFTSPPSETDRISMITNLDSDSTSNTINLHEAWDGSQTTPLGTSAYDYSTTVKVFDSLGSTHDVTIYFDPTTSNNWEYIVTCNPSEDQRTTAADPGTGLLARGTLTFNTSGTITSGTMSTFNGGASLSDAGLGWTAQSVTTNGYLAFDASFVSGTTMTIELNAGTRRNSTTSTWEPESLSTTQYSTASSTTFQSANGYGAGALQSVTVGVDGAITGQYSNGEVIPLYRVALAKFQNENGLYKEGGNLFRETRLSGDPITGAPGNNGLGSISPNSLEQSNVDIATEFVRMITTQRGFQANSKIITVTDQMLAELIALKR